MPKKPETSGLGGDESGGHGQNVSLDVLCRRAERLIDSVRMMGEQVDQMFTRPQRVVDEANRTARSLLELRKQLEDKLSEVQAAEQSCNGRINELRKTVPAIHQTAEALIQRVQRARELTDVFGKMMDSSADKIAMLQSAADEAAKARGAIDNAARELTRVQKAADHWTGSMSALTTKHTELIASGNAAAARLRTLSDAGERLGESVRQDIIALRELLRESRQERFAWEQSLARMSAGSSMPVPGDTKPPTEAPNSGQSVPAALASRVRRLADFVRQAAGATVPTASPEEIERRRASRPRVAPDLEAVPVGDSR